LPAARGQARQLAVRPGPDRVTRRPAGPGALQSGPARAGHRPNGPRLRAHRVRAGGPGAFSGERGVLLGPVPRAQRRRLRDRLVGAIRSAADEAAAMATEISASTEEMSASTEEMSATCQDLSKRAAEQAQLVRGAADDAAKILQIATVLASGAEDSVRRNTAVADIARQNK